MRDSSGLFSKGETSHTHDVPVRRHPKDSQVFHHALRVEELEAEMKIARDSLLEVVNVERDKALRSGKTESSVKIPTTDGNRVLVVYQERYKKLSDENVEPLKSAFGAEYPLLVDENEDVSLTKGTDVETLKKVLGEHFALLNPLLEVKKSVSPKKGAFEAIASYFKRGKVETATDLTTFVDACISQPQVRAK